MRRLPEKSELSLWKKKSKNISYNVAANLICSNKCIKWIWPSHLDSSKGDCFGLVLVVAGVCVCNCFLLHDPGNLPV